MIKNKLFNKEKSEMYKEINDSIDNNSSDGYMGYITEKCLYTDLECIDIIDEKRTMEEKRTFVVGMLNYYKDEKENVEKDEEDKIEIEGDIYEFKF